MDTLLLSKINETNNELTKALLEELENVGRKPSLNAEELLHKMANCTYQYSTASRVLRNLKNKRNSATKKAHTLILARRWDLLQNKKLIEHLKIVFDDPKYKPTVTDMDQFVYLETQEISEPYEVAKITCLHSKEEYEKWQGQLMWYMSQNKLDGIEMMTLQGGK